MFKANNGIPRQVKHLLILLLKQKQTKLVSHRCLSELPPLRLLQCNSVHLISYLGPSVMFIRFCFCFCYFLLFDFFFPNTSACATPLFGYHCEAARVIRRALKRL